MTFRTRLVGLVVGLAAVAVLLNIVGVLRYPGGPLRDPSDDGPLWLDVRPANQGSSTVGNSQPSDWAVAGQSYDFGLLTIHNPTRFTATIEAVTPLDSTSNLALAAVYLRHGSSSGTVRAFGPSGKEPDPATVQRDFVSPPATIEPSGETHEQDTQVLVVLRASGPGPFGFSALALDYRIGPFSFHAIQHLALAACLGPLPSGVTCPPLR